MIVEAAKLDARQYTVEYELLRSQATGTVWNVARENTAGQPRGMGLALLLNEGMPGWLKTVGEALRMSLALRAVDLPDLSAHAASSQCSDAPVWLSNVQRHEITVLLASLVLSTRPVAHSSRGGYRSW
jgi:hypothetical protein